MTRHRAAVVQVVPRRQATRISGTFVMIVSVTSGDASRKTPDHRVNTVAMLGRAYSLLGFEIVDGVVGAGYPQKPKHSAVFGQLGPEGARLTELARGANMTPQGMGGLVDELEQLGYVFREPDPADRRAKIIRLDSPGHAVRRRGDHDDRRNRGAHRLGSRGRGARAAEVHARGPRGARSTPLIPMAGHGRISVRHDDRRRATELPERPPRRSGGCPPLRHWRE